MRKWIAVIAAAAALVAGAASDGLAFCQRVGQSVVFTGGVALYSPFKAGAHLYVSGWRSWSDPGDYYAALASGASHDAIVGPDKIWRVTGPTTAELVVQRVGYHVGDPAVVFPPSDSVTNRVGWQYMYYSALPNWAAEPEIWAAHEIGIAVSTDWGSTWVDYGPISRYWTFTTSDHSAWSPGAFAVGGEIWVYYTDSVGAAWRQRLKLNGWEPNGEREPVTVGYPAMNIDVSHSPLGAGVAFLANHTSGTMIGRATDSLGPTGIAFLNDRQWLAQSQWPNLVLTPHRAVRYDGREDVYFAYGPGDGSGPTTLHRWTYDCLDSVP